MIGLKICNWVLGTRTFTSFDVRHNLPFNFCNLLILVFFFFGGGNFCHFRFRAFISSFLGKIWFLLWLGIN